MYSGRGHNATAEDEHNEFRIDYSPSVSFGFQGVAGGFVSLRPAGIFWLAVDNPWGVPLLLLWLADGVGAAVRRRGLTKRPLFGAQPALSVRAGSGFNRDRVARGRWVALAWLGGRGRRLAGLTP